jgi:hypothetical protein
VAVWRAAREQNGSITEADFRAALLELDPLWEELFRARIVGLLDIRGRSPRSGYERSSAAGAKI